MQTLSLDDIKKITKEENYTGKGAPAYPADSVREALRWVDLFPEVHSKEIAMRLGIANASLCGWIRLRASGSFVHRGEHIPFPDGGRDYYVPLGKRKRNNYTDHKKIREVLTTWAEEGLSTNEAIRRFGIPHYTLRRWANKWRDGVMILEGQVFPYPKYMHNRPLSKSMYINGKEMFGRPLYTELDKLVEELKKGRDLILVAVDGKVNKDAFRRYVTDVYGDNWKMKFKDKREKMVAKVQKVLGEGEVNNKRPPVRGEVLNKVELPTITPKEDLMPRIITKTKFLERSKVLQKQMLRDKLVTANRLIEQAIEQNASSFRIPTDGMPSEVIESLEQQIHAAGYVTKLYRPAGVIEVRLF